MRLPTEPEQIGGAKTTARGMFRRARFSKFAATALKESQVRVTETWFGLSE